MIFYGKLFFNKFISRKAAKLAKKNRMVQSAKHLSCFYAMPYALSALQLPWRLGLPCEI